MAHEISETKQVVITQDDISAILNSKRGAIIDGVVSGLVQSAKDSISWEMRSALEKTLGEEIKKIIAEESSVIAEQFRDGLREQIIMACTQVSAMLATAMVEKATKELSNSWTLEKIAKELF